MRMTTRFYLEHATKYYKACLFGDAADGNWYLACQWGAGVGAHDPNWSHGQIMVKRFTTERQAEVALMDKVQSKTARGYRHVTPGQRTALWHDNDTKIPQRVFNEIAGMGVPVSGSPQVGTGRFSPPTSPKDDPVQIKSGDRLKPAFAKRHRWTPTGPADSPK